MNRAAVAASLACALFIARAGAADPPRAVPPSGGRLFGTDEAPPPGVQPSGPRVVMRLAYAPAEGCPDGQVVRATISAQVRQWDPFASNAPWRLVVVMSHGAGYEGSAELRDVTGGVVWTRPLAPRARCFDLVEDLAVKLALKINPPAPPPPPVVEQPQGPAPAPDQPSQPPIPASEPSRVAVRFGVGTWMDLATAPRPAFGLTADVGFRVAWFSLAGEVRWDPPAGLTMMDGVDVSTALVMGALVPCGHAGWFAGCLVGELGQFRGSVGVAGVTPDHQAVLYGRGGVRLAAEIPVVRERLFVRLAANLLGAPKRPGLRLTYPGKAPQTEWESAAFTGGLGAGLFASF